MKEKELDLITWDNIKLDSRYLISKEKGNNTYSYSYKYQTAFEGIQEGNNMYIEPYKRIPKILKKVKVLDYEFEIDMIKELEINSSTLFTDFEKEHPKLASILKKRMPKNWFEKANANTIKERDEYKAKVQKQYDDLLSLYTELGSKSDLATMADINDLYYCEAHGFMEKLEKRINKKANPKNLKLYNKLCEIRGKTVITCAEG